MWNPHRALPAGLAKLVLPTHIKFLTAFYMEIAPSFPGAVCVLGDLNHLQSCGTPTLAAESFPGAWQELRTAPSESSSVPTAQGNRWALPMTNSQDYLQQTGGILPESEFFSWLPIKSWRNLYLFLFIKAHVHPKAKLGMWHQSAPTYWQNWPLLYIFIYKNIFYVLLYIY